MSSLASIHPIDAAIVDACLAGNEEAAAHLADDRGDALGYASSKAALARWVRRHAISEAWTRPRIPLNAVAPGTVVTPMTAAILATDAGRQALDEAVPMPLGHAYPEQVAPLIEWLASPANSHVTGQVVFVDGGAEAVLRGDAVW